jgi:hypothetical protein
MSRKVGTLLALAAVVAVGVAGYEVAHHFGGTSFAAESSPAAGSSIAGPSGVGSATPAPASASGSRSAPAATTSPAAVTTPANPQSGQTPATDHNPVPTGSSVRVVTTFHDWNATTGQVMVGGYVEGVIEDGGTCTLTLTSGSSSATGSTRAHADATTTACGAVTVPGSQLAAGTWNAVLSYRSPEHSGTAAPVTVQVPR